jgi:hypothetical protein
MQSQDPVVRGFTAARIGPDQFITFELFTTKGKFARAKQVYEMTVGGCKFADTSKAREQRAAMVTAGVTFFDSLTKDDFQSILSEQPERWERLYRPSKTGKRDDDTGWDIGVCDFTPVSGATREGWPQPTRFWEQSIVDSQSIFHMTYDRQEEKLVGRHDDPTRGGTRKARTRRTSPRTRRIPRRARVSRTRCRCWSQPAAPHHPAADQGDGTRAAWNRSCCLSCWRRMPLTYGFYAHQSQSERITMRRDSLERPKAEGLPWKLTTRLAEGMPETVSYYDARGVITKGDAGSGIVTEVITIKDLYDLWKKKGLPLD